MKLSGWFVALGLAMGIQTASASNATTPIDYTRRNAPFTAQPGTAPVKSTPSANRTVQDARVEKDVRELEKSSVGERRAAISVSETSAKNVVDKDTRPPARLEHPVSGLNQKPAAVSTAKDTRKPPLVAKYQDSLAAASATNMARFPAVSAGAKATINRFVFRKNAPDVQPPVPPGNAIPAAGGSPIQR